MSYETEHKDEANGVLAFLMGLVILLAILLLGCLAVASVAATIALVGAL